MSDVLDRKLLHVMRPSGPPDGMWDQRERRRVHVETEHDRLRTLHHLLLSTATAAKVSYLDAYQRFEEIAADAPHVTVRQAIKELDVKGSDVRDDLAMLEAATRAAAKAQERAQRRLDQVPIDADGRVLLDSAPQTGPGGLPSRRQPTGSPDNRLAIEPANYEAVMQAPLHSQRLARARQLAPRAYEGDAGAQAWQQADRAMAEADRDLLGSMELDVAVRAAQAAASTVQPQLDAAFQSGSSPKARRKLCAAALKSSIRMLDGGGL
jgi:IS1 family transposase